MSLTKFIEFDDLRNRLETAGYTSLKELQNKSIIQLAQDVELTADEVTTVESLLHEGTDTLEHGISATLVVKEQQHGITTSCQRLDQLFSPVHGIPRCGITEICGAPGSGKTQLCIQLSLNVQRRMDQGGFDGECIYIDTEGGLMNERFHQMAQTDEDPEVVRRKLQHIHYFRVLDHLEMLALVRQLSNVFKEYPKTKLLIIDSISYHLRLNIRDYRTRVEMLNFISQNLVQVANQFDISVVVTNQVTPDMVLGTWRPALGDSWSQWCTNRLFMTRKRHQRYATMYSAPQQTSKTTTLFSITRNGLKDVDEESFARMKQWEETNLDTEEEISPLPYHLESDLSPWPMEYDENKSWNDENEFPLQKTTATPPHEIPDDEQEQEDHILAPDSQPEHSYADLSMYDTTETPIDPTPTLSLGRRQLSPTNESTTKRQRPLDDKGTNTLNDSYEVLYDSQGDNGWVYD
ncbi:unnamed protein product [Absidia cylindrospora]